MNQQTDVWVLELTDYFMREQGYQLVSLSQEVTQTWLLKEESEDIPLIMITGQALSDIDIAELNQIQNTLMILVKSSKPALCLTVNDKNYEPSERIHLITPTTVSDQSIMDTFPSIQAVLVPTSDVVRAKHTALARIQKRLKRTRQVEMFKSTYGTMGIIGISTVMFLLSTYFLMRGLSMSATAVMLGAYYKPAITWAHEWWRFVTAGLLHIEPFHLLMNIIALRSMGRVLEPKLKSWRFLLIFITGVVFGNLFVFIRDESIIGLGMSAGVYALFGVFMVLMFETERYKNPIVRRELISVLAINIFISMLPNVSFTAHLGGLFSGVFFGFIFSTRSDWESLRKGTTVLLGAVWVTLIVLALTRPVYFEPTLLDIEVINGWYELGFKGYASYLRELMLLGH